MVGRATDPISKCILDLEHSYRTCDVILSGRWLRSIEHENSRKTKRYIALWKRYSLFPINDNFKIVDVADLLQRGEYLVFLEVHLQGCKSSPRHAYVKLPQISHLGKDLTCRFPCCMTRRRTTDPFPGFCEVLESLVVVLRQELDVFSPNIIPHRSNSINSKRLDRLQPFR
jgi:hypothetical protein